jgi:hypothetical protein
MLHQRSTDLYIKKKPHHENNYITIVGILDEYQL